MAQLKDLIVNGPSRFIGDVYATTFIGNLSGNASYATTAGSAPANGGTSSYTNYLNVVATNEIRMNRNGSSYYASGASNPLYINYSWAEGQIGSISSYYFQNGGGAFTSLTASGFVKSGSSSAYVLTGDGDHAAISGLSVNYATSAGSCSGNAATVSRATFGDSSNGEHNCNNIASNGLWYYTAGGPSGLGESTSDGALYSQAYSTSWVGQIAQDYRNGHLFVRGKNNGSWQNWLRIIDSSNIGSQSVNYASSSGIADRLTSYACNPDNSHPGYGVKIFYSWNTGQAGNASSGYSNGITIGSHPSDTSYGFQIVQNMWNDRTYTRRYNSGWQDWKELAWTSDLSSYYTKTEIDNMKRTLYVSSSTPNTTSGFTDGDIWIVSE